MAVSELAGRAAVQAAALSAPTRLVPVEDASSVGEARRVAAALATSLGFDDDAVARVSLVATEAATNLARHAQGGVLLVQAAPTLAAVDPSADDRPADDACVELIAVDRGPGIADLSLAFRDGYSTGGTPGGGFGALRRLSDEFDLYSRPANGVAAVPTFGSSPEAGGGTVMMLRCRASRGATPSRFVAGGVCVALAGEQLSGDAWAVVHDGPRCAVIVADGLGHGPDASLASQRAVERFRTHVFGDGPAALVARLHDALRPTRGAAVAVAMLDAERREVTFAGLGNISAALIAPSVDGESSRSLMSHNGTVGHQARRIQELGYAWPLGTRLLLHSDGLRSQWRLASYPGLDRCHPSVVAATLWRDQTRGRDDATVVVIGERGDGA